MNQVFGLDNFGQVLIATIANGKTFTWNAGAATPLDNRASTTTSGFATGNNPTASRLTLVSPTTRHLCHFGTETTIGTTTTQDDMLLDSRTKKILMIMLQLQSTVQVILDYKMVQKLLVRSKQKKQF